MKSEALKRLSLLIPEEDAIVAITWFSAEVHHLAALRDAHEATLTLAGASPEEVTAWRRATEDLLTFAHAMDWSLTSPEPETGTY